MDDKVTQIDVGRARKKKRPPLDSDWDQLKAEQVVAEKFVAQCGDRIRFIPADSGGSWYTWDDHRWEADPGGAGAALILQSFVKRMILTEIDRPRCDAYEGRVKFAVTCGNEKRQRAILNLARQRPPIVAKQEAFDTHKFLLNVQNGTVNLRTGELQPHRREEMLTQISSVAYNPQATCPRWDLFLSQVLVTRDRKPDQNLIDFVHRAVGYSLTGDPCEDAVFFLHGAGQNGKSTMLKVLKNVIGDYACAAKTETFTKTKDDGPKYDFACLYKKRFVVAMEVASNKRLAESVVKGASGGDSIVADRKYKDAIEFEPEFSLWFGVNHIPKVDDTDEGIWRRIRLIPFYASFKAGTDERDEHLVDLLAAEHEGILAWAVRGCAAYLSVGLGHATAVDDATASLRAEMDTFQAFIDDWFSLDNPQVKTPTASIRNAYMTWATANGAPGLSSHAITKILDSKGFERTKGSGKGRGFLGITLVDPMTLFVQNDTLEANSVNFPTRARIREVTENGLKVSFSAKSVIPSRVSEEHDDPEAWLEYADETLPEDPF
jgi:putative DNA primase/helicase